MKYLLIIFSCMLGMMACKSNKTIEAKISKTKKGTYYLTEGACFGFCCVYELKIESNGMATYDGKQNCDRKGTYQKEISLATIHELEQLFEQADFDSQPDFYPSRIADIKAISIKREINGQMKSTTFKEEKPQILVDIKDFMKRIAESADNWQPLRPEKEMNPDTNEPKNLKQLIIEPQENIQIGQWFKANKERFGLVLKRKISPNSNYWLFEYDHTQFTPKEILELLRSDTDLKHVDYNTVVNMR